MIYESKRRKPEFVNKFKQLLQDDVVSSMFGLNNNRMQLSGNVMNVNEIQFSMMHITQRVFERMVIKNQIDFYDVKFRRIMGDKDDSNVHDKNSQEMYKKIQKDFYIIKDEIKKIVNETLYMIHTYGDTNETLDKNNKFYDFINHHKKYKEFLKTGYTSNEVFKKGQQQISISKKTDYMYIIQYNYENDNLKNNILPLWVTFGNQYMYPFSEEYNKYNILFENDTSIIYDYIDILTPITEDIDNLDFDNMLYTIEY